MKGYRSTSAIPPEKDTTKSLSTTPGRAAPSVIIQERSQSVPVNAHRLDADPSYLQKMQKKDGGKPKYTEPEFVRVKAKDQIPITTFWTAVEGYFNPLTEEDRRFLMPKVSSLLYIPRLTLLDAKELYGRRTTLTHMLSHHLVVTILKFGLKMNNPWCHHLIRPVHLLTSHLLDIMSVT